MDPISIITAANNLGRDITEAANRVARSLESTEGKKGDFNLAEVIERTGGDIKGGLSELAQAIDRLAKIVSLTPRRANPTRKGEATVLDLRDIRRIVNDEGLVGDVCPENRHVSVRHDELDDSYITFLMATPEGVREDFHILGGADSVVATNESELRTWLNTKVNGSKDPGGLAFDAKTERRQENRPRKQPPGQKAPVITSSTPGSKPKRS